MMNNKKSYNDLQRKTKELEHINQVLRAVRNVNKLITKETDKKQLLKQVCELLIKTRGYFNAWIALVEDGKVLEPIFHAGFSGSFGNMADALFAGNFPECAEFVLEKHGVFIVNNPPTHCPGCILADQYADRAGMATRLESHGRLFGWMCVSIPKMFADNQDEQTLFENIGEDIAYALWSLEADAQRKTLLEKYDAILATNTNAVVFFSSDGIIKFFNPGAEKLFGFTAKEAIGNHVSIFAPPVLAKEQIEKIKLVNEQGALPAYETVRMTKEGKHIPVEITLDTDNDHTGKVVGFTAIVRDITKRKQAEEALLISEQKYKALYDNAPLSYQSLDEEGCFLDVNPTWLKTLGYERNEVIGKSYADFLHPDWKPHFDRNFSELKRHGIIHDVQFKLKHKNGHFISVSFEGCIGYNPDGSFQQTYCVFKDITEQKRAEEALQKSQRQLAAMMSNLPGMAYRCKNEISWPMIFVSEGCEALTGYKSNELTAKEGIQYGDLIHPEDREYVWDSVQKALIQGSKFTIEYRIEDRSGQERWVWEQGRAPNVGSDSAAFIEGFISDISDQKNAEKQLHEALLRQKEIVRAANVGLWDWNLRSNKVHYSAEWKRQIGHAEHEIGSDLEEWQSRVHPDDLQSTLDTIQENINNGRPHRQVEFRFRHKDGSYRWIMAQSSILRDTTGKPERMLGSHIDITEKKQNEMSLEWNARRNELLSNVAARLLQSEDPQRLVDGLCLEVMAFLNCDTFLNYLVSFKEGRLYLNAFAGIPEDAAREIEWLDYDDAVCGCTARGGHRIFRKDIPNSDKQDTKLIRSYGLQVNCCHPLISQDRIIGSLSFGSRKNLELDPEQISVMETVANLVAVALTRIETEKELRRSEQKFRDVFESISDPIYIHDDDGRFVDVNTATCEALGYTYSELTQLKAIDIIFESNGVPGFSENARNIRQKGSHVFESSHRRQDGHLIPVEIHSRAITFEGQPCILSVARDIRNRIESESKIRESEAKFSAFMKYLPGYAYIKDDNRRHLFVNHSLEKFFGKNQKELIGKTFEEILPIPEASQIKANDEIMLRERSPLVTEEDVRAGQDSQTYLSAKFPIELSDGEVLLGGISVDITRSKKAEADKKRTQRELIKRNQFIETILDNMPIGLAVNKFKDGKTTYLNKKFEEIYGWPKEELEGVTQFFENVFPNSEYRNKVKARVLSDIASGELDRMIWSDIEVTTKNGEKKIVFARNIPLPNQDLMISTVQDITDSRKLQDQLQQAQKMEAIGNLAGGIAHDFNNILFPIIGLSEMLIDDLPVGSLEQEHVREILKAGKRGSELVQQILSFSRQNDHKRIPVGIQKILRDVIKLIRSTLPTDIEIQQMIQMDCGLVLANPTQIHQVAMNLITNAYHAIDPNPGKITITLKETELEGDEWPESSLISGRYAKLSIADTGGGIDSAIIDKIFDPYFTTKPQGKGTGLGLSVVYGIVKEHGAEIKVYSEPETGTVFHLYFPIIASKTGSESEEKQIFAKTGNERILLVDDEKAVVKLEQKMLERLGYKVTSRVSSIEALKVFKECPNDFDLVITDMTMPNMTGDLLASELIAIRPDISIVVCTGFSERIDQKRAQSIGIKGLLMKPIVKSDMAEMVRNVLDDLD